MKWGDVKERVSKMKDLDLYKPGDDEKLVAEAQAEANNPPPEGTLQYRDFLVKQEMALEALRRQAEKQQMEKPVKDTRVPI